MTESDILIEISGAVTGLLYVYLEIIQKRSMWIVGALSAIAYIIIFGSKGLYGATLLQCYFLIMSVYGWITWGMENKQGGGESSKQGVRKLSLFVLLLSFLLSAIFYFIISRILILTGEDPMPKADALATVLSITATFWVTRRYRENWLLWIAVNLISLYIYLNQGLYPTSILYAVYTVAAVAGYIHWRKFRQLVV
ncbi:MAG: nicotinamide riboside transporter PnuC [Bacteroidales bacterium]|nr:nicotinamide riboside transporter PnuC [Bacteroidales bacterium]MDD2425612.1 nicotinamide riboside transporter PnuC [Bacteroidales bacterium]MDD3989760.1 nicotinamide riboside transporter PnuC [Bacteroidales bacterium]